VISGNDYFVLVGEGHEVAAESLHLVDVPRRTEVAAVDKDIASW
jgi:hypothetical protein